jgi:hypothetical protein
VRSFPPTAERYAITQALYDAGVGRVVCMDDEYALPSAHYLPLFGEDFDALRRRELARVEYHPEINDCDKFARLAWAYAALRHANTRQDACGLAFGFVMYQTDQGGGHAINVAMVRQAPDGAIHPIFWEPQTLKPITLSETERRTCFVLI